jgi:uncharacterized protein (DUF983 family)
MSAMNDVARCPKCGATNAQKVNFTWWGGALGPRLLNHVKCNNCGTQYNGKTGQSNTTAIVIYTVVILVIAIILYMLIANLG